MRRIIAEKNNRRKSGLIRMVYIAAPLLVVAIIIVVLALNSTGLEQKTEESVQELSVEQIVQQIQSKEKEAALDTVSKDSLNVNNVYVELLAVQRTWFRIVTDLKDTSEYILKEQEKLAFNADSLLTFLVGNAAGLSFTVNGTEQGVLGENGQVITNLKITSAGIISKNIKQINKKGQANDSTSVR